MIRYRYPGEEWVELDADNYTIRGTPNESTTYTINNWVYFKCKVYSGTRTDEEGLVHDPGRIWQIGLGGYFESIVGDDRQENIPEMNRYAKICGTYVGIFNNYPARNCSLDSGRTNAFFDLTTLEVVDLTTSTATINGCVFVAFKGPQYVFGRTNEEACPEVEVIEDSQCPEGTCEVTCGDTICCYGSDGIAVTSFPRT